MSKVQNGKLQNERIAVGQSIATPLRELEAQIDSAIEKAGYVMIAMASGRKRARVAAATGQDAFAALGESVNALFAGRDRIVACHRALEHTRDDLNVPVHAFGDEASKPAGAEREPLRVVA